METQRRGKGWEWVVTLAALALLGTVVVMQRPAGPEPGEAAAARRGEKVEPVGVDPLVAVGKGMVWWKWQSPMADPKVLDQMKEVSTGAAGKFRLALVAGEYVGAEEREKRFAEIEEKLAPESVLRKDIQTVRSLGAGADAGAVEELRTRHGWFARLAVYGADPAAEPEFRAQTQSQGFRLFMLLAIFGMGVLGALVAGVVMLILLIVRMASGQMRARFVRTPPELGGDGALWLEAFAVFLAGFLVVHLIGYGLEQMAGKEAAWPTAVVLGMQWLLVGVIFWPRLRGMTKERFKGELGWHRGRGVWREIAAGIMGYLAGLPVYVMMALVVVAVSAVAEYVRSGGSGGNGDDAPGMPENKVFELIGASGGWMLVLLGSLIVVWAPVVEESIFRGALYRHVRARLGGGWGLLASVAVVAGAFAAVHAYVLAGVVMVATLGAMFSLMREWRGSLIAPMTAHCVHNSAVLTLLVLLVPVMRG